MYSGKTRPVHPVANLAKEALILATTVFFVAMERRQP